MPPSHFLLISKDQFDVVLTSWELMENVISVISDSEDMHAAYRSVWFGDGEIRKSFMRSKPGAVSSNRRPCVPAGSILCVIQYCTVAYVSIYSFVGVKMLIVPEK